MTNVVGYDRMFIHIYSISVTFGVNKIKKKQIDHMHKDKSYQS